MNQMLTHAIAAKEQAKQEMVQSLLGKRKSEENNASLPNKRQDKGYGAFLKD